MLGVFPALQGEAEPVEINGVQGFKATVNAVTRNGEVVGSATAFCMRDEKTWASRDTYAIASMAQTRATSKALRMPLGFIVTLAGYSATPAEEIPPAERREPNQPAGGEKADKNDHAVLNIKLKDLEEKHPTTDQQSWLSALKKWSGGLGFPSTRKDWTKPQVHAAIKHVEGWLDAEKVPF